MSILSNQEKCDDVPASDTISYEHLLYYLEEGRETEFYYEDKEYFIDHSFREGRALWHGETRLSEYYSDNPSAVAEAKIDGMTVADLFKQGKVKVSTIL